ncbi:CHASE2 domain-containing protein [Thermaurantiacus sp.]
MRPEPRPRAEAGQENRASAIGRLGRLTAKRGLLFEWVGLLLAAIVAVGIATWTRPFERLDNLLYDAVLRLKPRTPSADIQIVAIDNRSLQALGEWPWPRRRHAELIDRLREAGAAVIGYDVLFLEPSASAADDVALADAIARAGNVVLPYLIDVPGTDGRASDLLLPTGALAQAAAAVGHASLRPDRDGVLRAVEHLSLADGTPLPHFVDVVAARASGAPVGAVLPPQGARLFGTREVRIRFAPAPGGYRHASFIDVLQGRIPRAYLAGRIILVGATGAGLGDRFATPVSGQAETMAGVELLANALDSARSNDVIRVVTPPVQLAFALAPVLLLMTGLLLLRPRTNLWIGAGLSIAVLATSASLVLGGWWVPPANALVALMLLFPLWGWRRLDFANRYMATELEALAGEGGFLRGEREVPVGDPVERQVALMHGAIEDVRNLKRFIAESLDSLPDATLVTDLDGRVLIVNEAARALLSPYFGGDPEGAPVADVLGAFAPVLADGEAEVLPSLARLGPGAMPAEEPCEWRLTDGRVLDVRFAFFSDDRGAPLGWILRLADITRLRAAERQREEALKLLTHDMRSPQASILALLATEARALPPALADRIARYARQTLELADQYVQFARAGTVTPSMALMDLAEALVDAVDDLWPQAHTRGVRMATDLPEIEVLVRGDRALLTRSIQNLLGNALKYGGGSPVRASIELECGQARLTVRDWGPGIAASDLTLVWEPFHRLAPAEGQPAEAGAGLGLPFVKRVVERHGGQVFAHSTPGAGAAFGFVLPLASEDR